jgi:hypothetical protein
MRTKAIKTVVLLLATFFIASCGGGGGASEVKTFYYKLQGKWESNDADNSNYKGALVISSDRITITGYGENQTPKENGDDNKRPFRQFPKNRALKGYSEDGKFFIENGGVTESIPYTFWEENDSSQGYKLVQYLKFTFGGRDENMDYKGQ